MGGNIQLNGSIVAGKAGCGCGDEGSTTVQALALSCAQAYGGAVVFTSVPLSISSPSAFVDLPLLEQLSAVEFLFAKFSSPVVLRFYAEVAELLGDGATFPTGFSGGETLDVQVDAYPEFTTTFLIGDQSAAQVAARINAAAVVAGYPFMPASVGDGGQVLLSGQKTGAEGVAQVTGGSAQSDLGFEADVNDVAHGSGSDVNVNGLFLAELDKQNPPTRVQVKGSASAVTLMAAGPSV